MYRMSDYIKYRKEDKRLAKLTISTVWNTSKTAVIKNLIWRLLIRRMEASTENFKDCKADVLATAGLINIEKLNAPAELGQQNTRKK